MLNRREFLAATSAFCLSPIGIRSQSREDVPWLREVQTPPAAPPGSNLSSLLPPGADLASWERRRREIRRRWLHYLGELERPDAPPATELLEEERQGSILRQLIRYESEPGWPTEAYIVRPAKTGGRPVPGVLVFHSTVDHSIRQPAGVEGVPEKAFGLELAKRGMVTLAPRNFLWPDNHQIDAEKRTRRFSTLHPDSKGMAKMLLDARVAADLLVSLPDVDPERLGAVGHSLGAKEVLYLAAFDERIGVSVSSEGGVGTQFSNWDAPWYLGPEIREFAARHEHDELLALVAPRPFLLVGGESADGRRSWPYVENALAVYRLYGEPPRLGFLNHQQGHAVPPIAEERTYEWLQTYL